MCRGSGAGVEELCRYKYKSLGVGTCAISGIHPRGWLQAVRDSEPNKNLPIKGDFIYTDSPTSMGTLIKFSVNQVFVDATAAGRSALLRFKESLDARPREFDGNPGRGCVRVGEP